MQRLLFALACLLGVILRAHASAVPAGSYVAPFWLPGGNLQTIYTSVFIAPPTVEFRRERWNLPDGDFLDFDWIDGQPDAPVVVLFHGLEGSSASFYAQDLMHTVQALGWNGVVAHFRGCSGEDNRLPRAYYAGDSEEIERILQHVKARFPHQPVYAVGVSLGANALLKWLGEAGEHAQTLVARAAGVSAPLDLAANRPRARRGLQSLRLHLALFGRR
jgi:Predicted hydrolase of the alpha/beta-hydrolase fold